MHHRLMQAPEHVAKPLPSMPGTRRRRRAAAVLAAAVAAVHAALLWPDAPPRLDPPPRPDPPRASLSVRRVAAAEVPLPTAAPAVAAAAAAAAAAADGPVHAAAKRPAPMGGDPARPARSAWPAAPGTGSTPEAGRAPRVPPAAAAPGAAPAVLGKASAGAAAGAPGATGSTGGTGSTGATAAAMPDMPIDTATDTAIDTAAAAAAAASADAAADATAGPAAALPVYATRLPPPMRLRYALQRGAAAGEAQLDWHRDGQQYALLLQRTLQGRALEGARSRGSIDADGVAPERLAALRAGREARAANFRRDVQRISYSGPTHQHPLWPGAQDRLSWMIQLPAVLEANPALRRPGARITLFVAGTGGDAEAWHFDVAGAEPLALPAGPVSAALRLVREPARPYDQRIDVWLDPARAHLPVQVRLQTVPGPQDAATEWRLAAAEAGAR